MSTSPNDPLPPIPASRAGTSGPDSRGTSVERRRRRRALISAPIRVRCEQLTGDGPDEVSTTIDVSRVGVLFLSAHPSYHQGMRVRVTFPYSKGASAFQSEQEGSVVRVTEISGGQRAIAISLGATGVGVDLVDALGRKLTRPAENLTQATRNWQAPRTLKPLVLVLDSEQSIRETVRTLLNGEGYEVIAVNNASDAREVLNLFSPVLVIAEIEGDGFPGYELCAHVKGTPRLQCVPVVLTTRSAYPSDYNSAHSLGALVCMAKPFRKERLAHVARLLAPLPHLRPGAAPSASQSPDRNQRS